MSATTSITDDLVFTALRSFLASVLPVGTEIIQLQDNGVPMPSGAFVGMNNSSNKRLSTNRNTYSATVKSLTTPSAYTVALDFYGPNSGAWAFTVQALFRDQIAYDLFPDDIKPLYADDPIQIPMVNAESGYEQRWRLDAVMQTNAVVTIGQQTANALAIGLINVDAKYPA